tara:strand:+ start:234 stop:719 length:486 start_codon:yes stop_codon:yes gene_type:complete
MFERRAEVLDLPTILNIYKMYRELPNQVDLNGLVTERHWPSFVGHFLVSKFSNEEFESSWATIRTALPKCNLIEARILKYSTGSHIPPHQDSHERESSDLSVILQLNHPDDYKGGDMMIDGQLVEMNQGDMVYYTYDVKHGVMPVKNGSRYVVNLRCKLVK